MIPFPMTLFGGTALPISIASSNLENIISTAGVTATFTAKPVGSGADRTILIAATLEDQASLITTITGITVGGTPATEVIELRRSVGSDTITAAIYALKLTAETGDVDIVVTASESSNSFALSYLILNGVQSITPTSSSSASIASGTSLASDATVSGQAGGITIGATAASIDGNSSTWGSSLTERADVATGGASTQHRHAVGYDLLPTGRAAATETVTFSNTSSGKTLVVASFR